MIILSYICSCLILNKISNLNKMVVRAKLCATRFRYYESDLYDVFMFSRTIMNLRSDSNGSRRGLSIDVGSGCTLYLVLR